MSEFMSSREAAEYLGVSRRSLYRYTVDGSLVSYRVGPKILRYRRADLDAFVRGGRR